MAHVPALPGAPDYDSQMGMQKLHDWVARDVEALQTGGVDAIMFGNEFDRPYVLKAPVISIETKDSCSSIGFSHGIRHLVYRRRSKDIPDGTSV